MHETAADPKLTHNDHDKLLPSQLLTLIASLLEHRCCKLSQAWCVISQLAQAPTFKNYAILSSSSSVSLCSTTISAISNPLLQTMLGITVTAASTSLKTDTSYILRGDGCCRPLRGKRRRVCNMSLDCIFFIWDLALFYGCVCIVYQYICSALSRNP